MKYLSALTILLLAIGLIGCAETLPTEAVGVEKESAHDAPAHVAESVAKKPMHGRIAATFNPGLFADPLNNPSWYGTLSIDEVGYGIVWYSLGSGKPFGADNVRGNAFFGAERFEIYAWIDFDPETQVLETGDPLMMGVAQGVMATTLGVFRAHGWVTDAYGDFAMWKGRPVKEVAVVVFGELGMPVSATGTVTVR